MLIIYFVVALFATVIGAIAGIGGGVIIKPVLDLLGTYDASTISVLSSFTVFAMAISSVIKQLKSEVKLKFGIAVPIAIGSVFGGWLGDNLFGLVLRNTSDQIITIIQNVIMIIMLSFILIYMFKQTKKIAMPVSNKVFILAIGVFLGTVSSFLSIGGGPMNICILMFFFLMDTKEAARNSILIIVFTQMSSITSMFMSGKLNNIQFDVLPLMIVGGILGGIIGSHLQKKMTPNDVTKLFNLVVIGLIVINIINIIKIC
ncbi:MAG: sulfite exporter TauE/SafE family protein [Coprobacillus sp.]